MAVAERTRRAAGLLRMIVMTVKRYSDEHYARLEIFSGIFAFILLLSIIPSNWRQGSDVGNDEEEEEDEEDEDGEEDGEDEQAKR